MVSGIMFGYKIYTLQVRKIFLPDIKKKMETTVQLSKLYNIWGRKQKVSIHFHNTS